MYLCAVDRDRMGVSLIQSNASGFGSLLFEPATGIGLHNRGIGFSLEPGHPAEYGPGRRPPHTLAPAVVTRPDGESARRHRHHGRRHAAADPPAAADAAVAPRPVRRLDDRGAAVGVAPTGVVRVRHVGRRRRHVVNVEGEAASDWADGLRDRGHDVEVVEGLTGTFGHAQLIEVTDAGLAGAADPRALVGAAVGY